MMYTANQYSLAGIPFLTQKATPPRTTVTYQNDINNNDKNYIRVWGGKKIIQTCSDEGASRHLNHLNPPLKLHRLLRFSGAQNPGPFLLLLDWLSGELQNQEVSCCAQSGERVEGTDFGELNRSGTLLNGHPSMWTPTTNKSQLSSHSLQLKQPLNSGYPATAYNKQL